ncbi:MAG: membrane protein insertase YidC [Pseudonocardiaceae bacterium]
MLNFIYYPVSAILWFWHNAFGYLLGPDNGVAWALAVVFLVFTLRALLYKPFVGQVRSMRKMQEFAPEVQKLKAKYGDDRQKMNAELQKLQSQHGVNPLGGCLPILVQIPVFIGLFHVLRSFNREFLTAEQNRQTGNYVFSAADVRSFLDADLFGVPLSSFITEPATLLARYGDVTRWEIAVVAVPLTIIAGILTHLTARHSVARQTEAQAANPQAAIMNKVMLYLFPLGVVAGGPFFPVAILIYWLSNNLWTLGQQHVVYQQIDAEETEKKEKAITQRQSLGPRPGQKPVRPKKETAGQPAPSADTGPPAESGTESGSGTGSESGVESEPRAAESGAGSPGSNGSTSGGSTSDGSVSGGSANGTSAAQRDGAAVPGMIQPRPRARKKTNRKRR